MMKFKEQLTVFSFSFCALLSQHLLSSNSLFSIVISPVKQLFPKKKKSPVKTVSITLGWSVRFAPVGVNCALEDHFLCQFIENCFTIWQN